MKYKLYANTGDAHIEVERREVHTPEELRSELETLKADFRKLQLHFVDAGWQNGAYKISAVDPETKNSIFVEFGWATQRITVKGYPRKTRQYATRFARKLNNQ